MITVSHEHGSTVVLPCGVKVEGRPHHTVSYVQTAHSLGYSGPNAALEMCQDHDVLHARLCMLLGLKSNSLHAAAGLTHDSNLAALEEETVLLVQRFMKTAGGNIK